MSGRCPRCDREGCEVDSANAAWSDYMRSDRIDPEQQRKLVDAVRAAFALEGT